MTKVVREMTIGKRILELRTAAGLSQEELAAKLEVSRQSVSKWETDTAVPDLDKLIKVADIFGVSLDDLACRTASVFPSAPMTEPTKAEALPSMHQRMIGYILLAASVISGALLVAVADSDDERLALFAVVAVFICSLLCLFLRRGAWYWCVWVAASPLILLTPFLVRMEHAVAASVFRLMFYAAMAVAARKRLYTTAIRGSTKRNVAMAAGWVTLMGAYVGTLATNTVFGSWWTRFLLYLLLYTSLSLLLTVTALYLPKKK